MAQLPVCAIPGQPLYYIDELILRPGDRVALLGVNGVGKSATFHLLRQHYAQEQSASPHVRFHPSVQLGFYDQQLSAFTNRLCSPALWYDAQDFVGRRF